MSPSTHSQNSHFSKSIESLKRKDLIEAGVFSDSLSFALSVAPFGGFFGFSQSFWVGSSFKPLIVNTLAKAGAAGVLGAAYQSASIISAHTRNQNDPINHAVGGFAAGLLGGCARGTFGRGLFYGVIAGFSAAMITEIFDQQYQRMTKPASELRPSSLLAVPNDPFAKRSKEFE